MLPTVDNLRNFFLYCCPLKGWVRLSKKTLLRCICGVMQWDGGSVRCWCRFHVRAPPISAHGYLLGACRLRIYRGQLVLPHAIMLVKPEPPAMTFPRSVSA